MFRFVIFFATIVLATAMPYETDVELEPIVMYRVRRQLSGSRFNLPGGGFSQSATLRGGPAFGSVSQSFDHRGFSSPQTFTGGLDLTNKNGHDATFGASKIPGGQSTLFAQGRVPIVNNDNHKLDAFASHTNVFNKNGQRLGEVNTGGLEYQHKSGFGANAAISHTPGQPDDKQIGITYTKEF